MIIKSKFPTTLYHWIKQPFPIIKRFGGLWIGSALLITVLFFLIFLDPLVNTFLKERITKAFTVLYPADSLQVGNLHFSVWKNTLECDSVVMKSSKYTFRTGQVLISGIKWIKILWNHNITPDIFENSVMAAQNTTLTFRESQSELHFINLHLSVSDSELAADSIKYYSLIDDDKFFAKSKFRQTRFLAAIPQLRITGLDCIRMFQGNIYNARSINLLEVYVDILVNMDKPYDKNSADPQMPNEFLSTLRETINIDSLIIFKGHLKYSEQYVARAKPGVITFDDVKVSAGRISNHTDKPDTTVIIGEGLFLNSGKMKLLMEIPLTTKDFSLHYSGSLSHMEVTGLNSFIEKGEHHRIKSGILKSARFDIKVIKGHANGSLNIEYTDLSLILLNKATGSEKGIFDRISSLFGKIFIIRGSNLPDKNGFMKIGETIYSRNANDYFFQFIWFALRNGIGDVVGFPPI